MEGGSANDYEYTSGDPVNGVDLSGEAVYGTCATGSFGWGLTLEGSFCVLLDDEGGSTVTYAAGFGGGLEAGGAAVAYYSNAPTVDDVLGWSACINGGGGSVGGSFCAFEGSDGESDFSVTGFAINGGQRYGGHISAVYAGEVPRWLRGAVQDFVEERWEDALGWEGSW